MKLDHQADACQSVDVRLTPISTPLKIQVWEECLCSHPDKDLVAYILKGIKQGFRIGIDSKHNLISATKNMRSAALNLHRLLMNILNKSPTQVTSSVLFQKHWLQMFTLIDLR